MPRSLAGRLLGISAITTLVALVFAAITIGNVLERFVLRGLDQQLDAQVAMLARAVRSDGRLDQSRIANLPAFETGAPGWGWQVEGLRGRWSGGDRLDAPSPPRHPPPPRRGRERNRAAEPRPGDGLGASGERVHFRQLSIATEAGPVRVTAMGPRRVALAPLRQAMVPLLGSLALLGVALAIAAAVQLRFGLRPLRRLGDAVAEVRQGRRRYVPSDQPEELAPLASELNALIDRNEAQLDHARRHVANLAHGLKTPLAALSVKLAEDGRDPDGGLRAMVAEIDGRVRHHLGRARAATPGGAARARTLLAPAVADLLTVLQSIHSDRPVAAEVQIAPDTAVAVDPQDLDEMLGNLLDNAWRHAGGVIEVQAVAGGTQVRLTIEDDGPGLSAEAIEQALVPGRRLDERGDGHGFGLPIAQELAELSGGALALSPSPSLGGLRAELILPASLG